MKRSQLLVSAFLVLLLLLSACTPAAEEAPTPEATPTAALTPTAQPTPAPAPAPTPVPTVNPDLIPNPNASSDTDREGSIGAIVEAMGMEDRFFYQYTPEEDTPIEEVAVALYTMVLEDMMTPGSVRNFTLLGYRNLGASRLEELTGTDPATWNWFGVDNDPRRLWRFTPSGEVSYTGTMTAMGPVDGYVSSDTDYFNPGSYIIAEENGTYTLYANLP